MESVVQVRFRNYYNDKAAILVTGNSNQPINVLIANLISKTIDAQYKKPAV